MQQDADNKMLPLSYIFIRQEGILHTMVDEHQPSHWWLIVWFLVIALYLGIVRVARKMSNANKVLEKCVDKGVRLLPVLECSFDW